MEIRHKNIIVNIDQPISPLAKDFVKYVVESLDLMLELDDPNVYAIFVAGIKTTENFIEGLTKEEKE